MWIKQKAAYGRRRTPIIILATHTLCMPLKIFRRKPAPKVTLGKPHIKPRTFSRRTFLKGAVALAGASVIGCRTAPLTEEQFSRLEKIKKLEEAPPIITALKQNRSVKQMLEEVPFIKSQEISFHREGVGKWRDTTLERGWSNSKMLPPKSGTKSILHTHPTWNSESPIEKKMDTIPSAMDLFGILLKYKRKSPSRQLKFSHIAVISPQGKVMGYYTLAIGRKLERTLKADTFSFLRDDVKKFNKVLDELSTIHKMSFEAPYAAYLRLEKTYATLKKMGLLVRQTPLPGYTFKDGYFQPKT